MKYCVTLFDMFSTMVDILTALVLALIMFSVGMTLSVRNFKTVLARPRAIILGLILQMIFLPLLGYAFVSLINMSIELKIGFMILVACPGGTTSNLITYLLNNNTALAIVVSVLNSFLSIISIPLILGFSVLYIAGEELTIAVPVHEIIVQVLSVILIPVVIGVYVNERSDKIKELMSIEFHIRLFSRSYSMEVIKAVSLILLAVVFSFKLLGSSGNGGVGLSFDDIMFLLPRGIILNLVGLFISYLIPYALNFKMRTSVTLSIQVGLQNTTLAFLIAAIAFNNQEVQKPALVYAFFSFWVTVIFGIAVNYFNGRKNVEG